MLAGQLRRQVSRASPSTVARSRALMYIAGVSRDHFLTEIHLEKKIPRVHVVHTIDTDRKPALMIHYEVDVQGPDDLFRITYTEIFPAKIDHTVDLTNSLLEQLRRDHVAHEIEGA